MPFVIVETSNVPEPDRELVKAFENILKSAWVATGQETGVNCQATDVGGVIVFNENPVQQCTFIYNDRGEDFHRILNFNIHRHISFGFPLRLIAVKSEQWFEDPAWTIREAPHRASDPASPFPVPQKKY